MTDSNPFLPPGVTLNDRAALFSRQLEDGRMLDLWWELTGTLKLSISRSADELGSDDEWQYQDQIAAYAALTVWDGNGEPEGWYRHMRTGRRRPDGDPTREYINP